MRDSEKFPRIGLAGWQYPHTVILHGSWQKVVLESWIGCLARFNGQSWNGQKIQSAKMKAVILTQLWLMHVFRHQTNCQNEKSGLCLQTLQVSSFGFTFVVNHILYSKWTSAYIYVTYLYMVLNTLSLQWHWINQPNNKIAYPHVLCYIETEI